MGAEPDQPQVAKRPVADATAAQPDTIGKRSGTEVDAPGPPGPSAATNAANPAADAEARIRALIATLERQFARNPAQAKQTATTLSAEFPEQFDAEWLLKVFTQIDDVAWRKRKINEVMEAWDERPSHAKSAIAELRRRYKTDAALKRWGVAMERQIDDFQLRLGLEARIRAWDRRPGDAQAAARELHRRWPRQYPGSWRRKFEAQVWTFQDVKWAEKISSSELQRALGDNVIDWDDAPLEVKQELQIRLGRQKAAQHYGKGGEGSQDRRELVVTDEGRTTAMSQAERAAPEGSTFSFSSKEELPLKRLDLTAKRYDDKSQELLDSRTPEAPQSTNPLLAQQPSVVTTLFNKVLTEQAAQLRERGAAYRNLRTRIASGETTISTERELIRRDLFAIDNELRNLYPQLRQYERDAAKDPNAASRATELRAAIESMKSHEVALNAVLAQPDGVVPGAGALARAMPGPSFSAPTKIDADARRQAAEVTDLIDRVTVGDDPYAQGVGRNVNEQLLGAYRFLGGRVNAFQAGVTRMVGNLGSYVLPTAWSASILGLADQLKATSLAIERANTSVTARTEAAQQAYTRAGGEIPMIDRVFSNQKIFEKPDVALLALLQAVPQGKGAAFAVQATVNGLQTIETFFSTYGKTGDLGASLSAAGWGALQAAAGLALERLGVPASVGLVANVAMVYGFGRARGLSAQQIQEEIAFTLVGAAVGGATGALKRGGAGTLEGVAAKSRAVVEALDERSGAAPVADEPTATTTETSAAETTRRARQLDQVANELATAMSQSRELTRVLQEQQRAGRATKGTVEELRQSAALTRQKRAELRTVLEAQRPVTTSSSTSKPVPVKPPVTAPETVAPTTTESTEVTPTRELDATTTPVTEPKLLDNPASPRELAPWLPPKNAIVLKAAIEAGPGVWTKTGNTAAGDIAYQRGLTGDYTKGLGVQEAQGLLSGKADPSKRYVTLYGEGTSLTGEQATSDITSQYASPMAVRGKVSSVTERGGTTARAEGLDMSTVESIAFLPNVANPYAWAKAYLQLARSSGLKIDPASRGGRFLANLEDVIATKPKFGNDDGFGRPILNADEVETALRAVFDEYAAPAATDDKLARP